MKSLKKLLVCPICKKKLKSNPNYYECTGCSVRYPILSGIPVFIKDGLYKDSSEARESNKRQEFWNKGWGKRIEKGDLSHLNLMKMTGKQLKEHLNAAKIEKHLITIETNQDKVDGKIVLDIGCGAGSQAPIFAYYGANYIGIDFSYNAARYSYEYLKIFGGNGITAQADAEALPIESESIDFVYSNGVLHHTPNTPTTFDEIDRVLKPGGEVAIGLYVTFSPMFILDKFIGFLKGVHKGANHKWFNESEGAWRTGDHVNLWTKTYTKRELKNLLHKYSCHNLHFRKFGFSWGNAIPKIGKHIDKVKFGRLSRPILAPMLGGMWAISFMKD